MSDWRGNDDKKKSRSGDEPKGIPRKPLPVIPPKPPLSAPATNWRGKKTHLQARPTSNTDRTWTGAPIPKKSSSNAGFRILMTSLFSVGILVVGWWFFVKAFSMTTKMPLLVTVAKEVRDTDFGVNSFAAQTLDRLKNLQSENDTNIDVQLSPNTSGQFVSGGPDENVTTIFVSGLVIRDAKNDVYLVENEKFPTIDEAGKPSGLLLQEFFTEIAEKTRPSCLAWIVLDVRPPPVVANLGDLEFPATEIENAFESVKLKDRLIVTLPCSSGEESWMSPEHGCSWFAHVFLQGLGSGFDSPQEKVRLDHFKRELQKRVQDQVALRRKAVQTPKFLTSRPKVDQTHLFVRSSKISAEIASGFSKERAVSAFKKLDDLWNGLKSLEGALRSNPVEYSAIESELILLEELAENGAEELFAELSVNAEKRIEELSSTTQLSRRYSLIEVAQHSASSKSSEAHDQIAQDTWHGLQTLAMQNDDYKWNEGFKRDILDAKLQPQYKSTGQTEWLEIQILRILNDEMALDPNRDTIRADYQKHAKSILSSFAQLQGMACRANHELSWWTSERLRDLNFKFLNSFDRLLSVDYRGWETDMNRLAAAISEANEEVSTIDLAMKNRDEAIHYVPHLLAWFMRMNRYQNQGEQAKKFLERTHALGDVLVDALKLRDRLGSVGQFSKPTQSFDLNSEFKSIADEHERLLSVQKNDPETIRNIRVALRWPLLDIGIRRDFHLRLVDFYSEKIASNEGAAVTAVTNHPPSNLAERFVQTIVKSISKEDANIYRAIATSDLRVNSIPTWRESAKTPNLDASTEAQFKSVYSICQEAKMMANALGQRINARRKRLTEWPYSAATAFGQMCDAKYTQLQVDRLCDAKWGDGDLDQNQGKFYFEELVDEVVKSKTAAPLIEVSKYCESITRESSQSVAAARQALSTMDLQISEVTSDADQLATRICRSTVSAGSGGLNAWGNLSLSSSSDRRKRLPFLGRDRILVDLNKRNDIVFEFDHLVSITPTLFSSLRGHYQSSELEIAKSRAPYIINFARNLQPPTITVRSSDADPVAFYILLDCSGSMKNIHDKAKQAAIELVEQLRGVNRSGQRIHVGLMVFGRSTRVNDPQPIKPNELAEINNQTYATTLYDDSERFDRIIDLIRNEWVSPRGGTPLHDAIFHACIRTPQSQRSRLNIAVISDGVDDLEGWGVSDDKGAAYNGDRITFDKMATEVRSCGASVYIFQKIGDIRTPDDSTAAKKFAERARAELIPAKASGKARNVVFDSFEEISSAVRESFPIPKVAIKNEAGTSFEGKFNESIPIQAPKPLDAFSSYSLEIDPFPNARQTFQIRGDGNEALEYRFDFVTKQLFSSDIQNLSGSSYFEGVSTKIRLQGGFTPTIGEYSTNLRLSIQPTNTSRDHSFVKRPDFVLAEIRPSDDPSAVPLLLGDWNFDQSHFPIVELPSIKWKDGENWRSNKKVDVTVWMMDSAMGKLVELSSGDEKREGDGRILCRRNANSIRTELDSSLTGQYFVVCPHAVKSKRSYSSESDYPILGMEVHEFELPDDHLQSAKIVLFALVDLEAVKARPTDKVQVFSKSNISVQR